MKNEPFKHIHFDILRSPLEEQPFKHELAKIAAQVTDMTDRTITEAITEAAIQEGLTDLYLIDRRFILEAIEEKVKREKNEPLTLEEALNTTDPVWIQEEYGTPGKVYGEWGFIKTAYNPEYFEIFYFGIEEGDLRSRKSYGKGMIAYRHKPREDEKKDGGAEE